jgi:diguanylate cyclase (GGDEF)-like protein
MIPENIFWINQMEAGKWRILPRRATAPSTALAFALRRVPFGRRLGVEWIWPLPSWGRWLSEGFAAVSTQFAENRSAESAVRLLTVLFVVALWAFFSLWAYHHRADARTAASSLLERQRVAAEAQVHNIFKVAEVFIAVADRWLIDHPDEDPRSNPQFLELVLSFQRVTDSSMMVRLVSDSGELYLIPPDGPHQGIKVDDRDYFKGATASVDGKVFIGAPFQGRATGRWAVPVAARFSRASHGLGVILVAIETDLIDRAFGAIRSDKDPTISLVRRDGILLARSATRPLDLGISVAQSPVFTEGLVAKPHGVVLTASATTDHIPRMMAYGEMSGYPLVIVADESIEAIEAPSWRAIRMIAALLFLITLLTLFCSWRSLTLLAALRASQDELARHAGIDELTGLTNRRQFLDGCTEEILRAKRYGQPLAFLEIDLDFFKRINDAYGHPAGDAVLQAFARVGKQCLRDVDSFGRLGGEEFGMLLPNTGAEGALHLAERIVAATAACAVPTGELSLRFMVSVGCTELGADDTGFESVFARADKALYEAKASGRNCARIILPGDAPKATE